MRASAGVSALVRTFMRARRIRPFHDGGEIAREFRLQHGHRAFQHLADAAIERDDVALAKDPAGGEQRAGAGVDAQASGARHARLAHAARHDRRVAGHAAARGENPFGGMHAVNVFRARLDAHQDHRAALALHFLRLVGREHDFAGGSPRRRGQPTADHLAGGARVDGRVQQLVERGRVDCGSPPPSG